LVLTTVEAIIEHTVATGRFVPCGVDLGITEA
jgi:hypothetical protein